MGAIELVFTPDHWHTIPAMHAMAAGLHVYAEKPLTLNLRESQLILAAQKQAGVTFQTGSQQRNEFGGILADFGAHMFDIAQWGFQKDRESPVTIIPPKDANAKRGVKMVYADGKTLVHAPGDYGIKFIGEKGSIWVDRGRLTSEPASILEEPLTDTDKRLHKPQNHLNNFVDCIGTDKQPVADVEVGARTAALCHLANISYDVKEELKFDGKAWKFTNSQAANAKLDYAERRKDFELPKLD